MKSIREYGLKQGVLENYLEIEKSAGPDFGSALLVLIFDVFYPGMTLNDSICG